MGHVWTAPLAAILRAEQAMVPGVAAVHDLIAKLLNEGELHRGVQPAGSTLKEVKTPEMVSALQ